MEGYLTAREIDAREIHGAEAKRHAPHPLHQPLPMLTLSRLPDLPHLENPKSPPRLPPRSPDIRISIPPSHTITIHISRIRAILVASPPVTANTAVASIRILTGFARAEAGEEDDEHAEEQEQHGGEDGPHSGGVVRV